MTEFDPDLYLAKKRAKNRGEEFDPDAYLAEKRGPAEPEDFSGVTGESSSTADPTVKDKLLAAARGKNELSFRERELTRRWRPGDPSSDVEKQQDKERLAAMAGLATGGAGGALLRGAGGLLSQLFPRLGASGLARGAGAVAAGAGEGYAGGAGSGAAMAAQEGVPLEQIMSRAKDEAETGAIFGAAAPAAAGLIGGASKLVRKDPWVAKYLDAKKSGAYARPDMQDLEGGAEGIQQAAERSTKKIIARDQELGAEASKKYNAAVPKDDPRPVSREKLVKGLEKRQGDNLDPDTGLPLNDAIDAQLAKTIERTAEKPTVGGTLARRRALKQKSAFDSVSPSDEQLASRDTYQAFRQAVRDAAPDVAAADDAYSAHARQASRRRDILLNTEDNVIPTGNAHPDALPIEFTDELLAGAPQTVDDALNAAGPMRVAKERSAITTVKRAGDVNEPGLKAQKYLTELAEQDETFRAALEYVEQVKAKAATRFGLETPIPNSLSGVTKAFGAGPMIQQNARALGARVVDPASRAGAVAADVGGRRVAPVLNPILRANEEDKKRRKRQKQTLTGSE